MPAVERRSTPSVTLLVGCLCLTAVATVTMLRIELLNARAGNFLPRSAHFGGHNPKWREIVWPHIRESMELEFRSDGDFERPLTADEQAQIAAVVERAQLKNDLRSLVGTWGLTQYLVAPLALAFAGALLRLNRGRLALGVGVVCACLSVAAIVSMFYREYLASLGW